MSRVHAEITKDSIAATRDVIRPWIRRTPVIEVRGDDFGIACDRITLKLELFQHAGSFKARGAFANLLLRPVPDAGVVAASGGNHGVAVAYAAKMLGKPATIFVPNVSSPAKIAKIQEFGAKLIIHGDRYADALAASEIFVAESGAMAVHAFEQVETLLGQGTLGLELEEQAGLDTLLVAVGGGGLIGGIAAWFAGQTKIVAVEPMAAPTLAHALAAGHPVDAPAGGIAADSLAPKRVGEMMFPFAQDYVSESILVEDNEISNAQRVLWDNVRIASEPGGATAMAALLSGKYRPRRDERVGVVICGGNTGAVSFG